MSFDEFYDLYPRHIAKLHAEKMYLKALKTVTHETIMVGLRNDIRKWNVMETETQHIPHPGTWLNKGHYTNRDMPEQIEKEQTPYCRAFRIRWELRKPPDWQDLCGGRENAALKDWDQSIHGPKPADVDELKRRYRIDHWNE